MSGLYFPPSVSRTLMSANRSLYFKPHTSQSLSWWAKHDQFSRVFQNETATKRVHLKTKRLDFCDTWSPGQSWQQCLPYALTRDRSSRQLSPDFTCCEQHQESASNHSASSKYFVANISVRYVHFSISHFQKSNIIVPPLLPCNLASQAAKPQQNTKMQVTETALGRSCHIVIGIQPCLHTLECLCQSSPEDHLHTYLSEANERKNAVKVHLKPKLQHV